LGGGASVPLGDGLRVSIANAPIVSGRRVHFPEGRSGGNELLVLSVEQPTTTESSFPLPPPHTPRRGREPSVKSIAAINIVEITPVVTKLRIYRTSLNKWLRHEPETQLGRESAEIDSGMSKCVRNNKRISSNFAGNDPRPTISRARRRG
jgi:hypothetical protein